MDKNAYEVLKERGFISQSTHEEEIIELLSKEKISFYIGFDPTADSLTAGHFVTVMAMAHMQRAGHRPICLVGGGTGMVGDPTDKTEMRRLMTHDEIMHNVNCFKKQLEKFIDFTDDKAKMVNNADWLLNLNYIDFIRTYGVHFSVNKMLTADAYKARFEKGLTFFEFNYMLMQSYDFLELYRTEGCKMQLGGQDQWSNIIGGVELIRRCDQGQAYGMTFNLLTTSEGIKMGKTLKGALFLDPKKTSPYEFFQYFRNVADADVIKCLKLLTFLPIEEINELEKLEGAEINKAKEILAFEVTKIVHDEEEAKKALEASKSLFAGGGNEGSTPTTEISLCDFENSQVGLLDLLVLTKICPSKSEARRNVEQGGVKIDGEKVTDVQLMLGADSFKDGSLLVQRGKKVFHRVKIK